MNSNNTVHVKYRGYSNCSIRGKDQILRGARSINVEKFVSMCYGNEREIRYCLIRQVQVNTENIIKLKLFKLVYKNYSILNNESNVKLKESLQNISSLCEVAVELKIILYLKS